MRKTKINKMNKYTSYVQKNYLIIGAIYHDFYLKKGKGMMVISKGGLRLNFKPYKKLEADFKAMLDRNPDNVILSFAEDKVTVAVQLPESPKKCYEKIGSQLDDFIRSRGIENA